jgi:hypothetical protein
MATSSTHAPAESLDSGERLQQTRNVKISEEARAALEAHEVTDEQIDALVGILSHYEYGGAVKKAQALGALEVVIAPTPEGDVVVIPGLYDFHGSRKGQCTELTYTLNDELTQPGGWRDDVNRNGPFRPSGEELVVCMVKGYSPTHFLEGNGPHTWTGLATAAELERARNEDRQPYFIDVDPSFATISTGEHTAQRYSIGRRPPTGDNFQLRIGRCEVSGTTVKMTVPLTSFRASADQEYFYSIGIARHGEDLVWCAETTDAQGKEEQCVRTPDGVIVWEHHDPDVNESSQQEIKNMLDALAEMRITTPDYAGSVSS